MSDSPANEGTGREKRFEHGRERDVAEPGRDKPRRKEPRQHPLRALERRYGRRALLDKLRATATPRDDSRPQATAERGVAEARDPLPHAESIQRSFGRFDVGHVRANVGGRAGQASKQLQAEAYTVGNRTAFSKPRIFSQRPTRRPMSSSNETAPS